MSTVVRWMFFVLCLTAAGARADEAPPGVAPPPPTLLDPETTPTVEPGPPPLPDTRPSPDAPPESARPTDAAPPPPALSRPIISALARGAWAGSAGAAAGALLGGAALLYASQLAVGAQTWLLVLSPALPALASFFGGAAVIAFALDEPTAQDWASVAGCTAVGCVTLGAVLLGAGGFSLGTGCQPWAPCSTSDPSPTRGNERIVWASAGAGIGAALGLVTGVGAGLLMPETSVDRVLVVASAMTAGSALGGGIGGAIGGGMVGQREDERRSAPSLVVAH